MPKGIGALLLRDVVAATPLLLLRHLHASIDDVGNQQQPDDEGHNPFEIRPLSQWHRPRPARCTLQGTTGNRLLAVRTVVIAFAHPNPLVVAPGTIGLA